MRCQECGKLLPKKKKTLYTKPRTYCGNKCRLVGARKTFLISRYDFKQ